MNFILNIIAKALEIFGANGFATKIIKPDEVRVLDSQTDLPKDQKKVEIKVNKLEGWQVKEKVETFGLKWLPERQLKNYCESLTNSRADIVEIELYYNCYKEPYISIMYLENNKTKVAIFNIETKNIKTRFRR